MVSPEFAAVFANSPPNRRLASLRGFLPLGVMSLTAEGDSRGTGKHTWTSIKILWHQLRIVDIDELARYVEFHDVLAGDMKRSHGSPRRSSS